MIDEGLIWWKWNIKEADNDFSLVTGHIWKSKVEWYTQNARVASVDCEFETLSIVIFENTLYLQMPE